MTREEQFDAVITFLRSLGLVISEGAIGRETLVPGLDIWQGGLRFERDHICKPADMLHEAAHILLSEPAIRPTLDGTISSSPAEELTAIAWTWAAAMHLSLDPADVFHDEVVSGNGETLRENFSNGRYVGVPGLQRWRMTEKYPRMRSWVRG